MSTGTPFHERTSPLNRTLAWGDWAGYHSAAVYADHHDIEYNAIRQSAALIDVSPLFKYVVAGPDAVRLIDRVITRDATRLAVGQVLYTPWCDERGKVIDDGTVARLDETTFRWTAADPCYRWILMNAAGLDAEVQDVTDALGALALQGPRARAVLEAATGAGWSDVGYFRRRTGTVAGIEVDVTRTGYTGDLGYELWVAAGDAATLWDALLAAGEPHGLRPCGIRAMDVARVEAGLVLIEVDYTSARTALTPEHEYTPFEIGLGRLVSFEKADFVGRAALERERDAGGRRQAGGHRARLGRHRGRVRPARPRPGGAGDREPRGHADPVRGRPGRPCHEHVLVADAEEDDRTGVARSRRAHRGAARDGVVGRGRARPGGGAGGRPALPRPRAQARLRPALRRLRGWPAAAS